MQDNRRFHFISGLPRSGSTLLAAILSQNPQFYAGISSPVSPLFDAILDKVSAGSELASLVSAEQRARLFRGIFDSCYAQQTENVVFDTNRNWTARLPDLMQVFPEAKVICLVRNVAWIMDSLERQYRNAAFEHTRLFLNAAERSTVYSRVEALANADRLVGQPWHALREACYSDAAGKIVIVDYDLLVRRPDEVVALLYDFLNEPAFDHDFGNVHFDTPEFDAQIGLPSLHEVRPTVAYRERKSILPPDLFEKYANRAFWADLDDSKVHRIVHEAS